jgi:hypothetical protein
MLFTNYDFQSAGVDSRVAFIKMLDAPHDVLVVNSNNIPAIKIQCDTNWVATNIIIYKTYEGTIEKGRE